MKFERSLETRAEERKKKRWDGWWGIRSRIQYKERCGKILPVQVWSSWISIRGLAERPVTASQAPLCLPLARSLCEKPTPDKKWAHNNRERIQPKSWHSDGSRWNCFITLEVIGFQVLEPIWGEMSRDGILSSFWFPSVKATAGAN